MKAVAPGLWVAAVRRAVAWAGVAAAVEKGIA